MKRSTVWLAAAYIGVINAVVLWAFELIGVDITNWLWNDLLNTDEFRWRVVPVALILGLVLTAVFKLTGEKRLVSPKSDLMDEMDGVPSTLLTIGKILAVGAMSLLAGASLGPEASLMAASAAIGGYAANKQNISSSKNLLILASIGALLVAFVDTLILLLIPLLLLLNKKQLKFVSAIPIILASLTSFATTHFISYLTDEKGGYGSVPAMPELVTHDFVVAAILGFAAASVALSLNWLIGRVWQVVDRLARHKSFGNDWTLGLFFSLVLGVIYLSAGQSVQFSGSIGSGLLVHDVGKYGALALGGLIIAKLLATAWSKSTGFRGGLVFPSVYSGVALGLLVGQISDFGGAGAMIGGISGMMTAVVGSPIMAAIFLIAILPLKLWPIGLCAIVGTLLFNRLSVRLSSRTGRAT